MNSKARILAKYTQPDYKDYQKVSAYILDAIANGAQVHYVFGDSGTYIVEWF